MDNSNLSTDPTLVDSGNNMTQAALFPVGLTWEETGDDSDDQGLVPHSADEDSDSDLALEEIWDLIGFEEPPMLVVNTEPEAAVARQKEMMDAVFNGIGEEKKAEKRVGLAMQQLDLEQRHSMRLLLMFDDPAELTAHLKRCLDDPIFGYGERGNNGRTIAQAMAALGDLDEVVQLWFALHNDFRQRVLNGQSISFRSTFDAADLTTFAPIFKRVGPTDWQLGSESEGKCRVFKGSIVEVWDTLCDTYVEWCDADNKAWLDDLKQKAERSPDSILRAAYAERLRKEVCHIQVNGLEVILEVQDDGQDWPRSLLIGDQIGLSRLSGHSFYELAWEGGLHVRRFDLNGTSKNKVPIEHIELAIQMVETLAAEYGLAIDPVTANDVEAAYLRRLKIRRAELVRPKPGLVLPRLIKGTPAAMYKAGDLISVLLQGDKNDFAYISYEKEGVLLENGVLLQINPTRGLIESFPVTNGRPMRSGRLMDTPLSELNLKNGAWLRALSAWGAWLVKVTCPGTIKSSTEQ